MNPRQHIARLPRALLPGHSKAKSAANPDLHRPSPTFARPILPSGPICDWPWRRHRVHSQAVTHNRDPVHATDSGPVCPAIAASCPVTGPGCPSHLQGRAGHRREIRSSHRRSIRERKPATGRNPTVYPSGDHGRRQSQRLGKCQPVPGHALPACGYGQCRPDRADGAAGHCLGAAAGPGSHSSVQ